MVEKIVIHLDFSDMPPSGTWTGMEEQEYWERLYRIRNAVEKCASVRYVEVVNETD